MACVGPQRPGMLRGSAVLALISAVGCSRTGLEPPSDGGARPSVAAPACDMRPATLDECDFVGDGYADCGGEARLRYACTQHDCRWFRDECVPLEYEVSPCPVDDLCCLDDWPFPGGWDSARVSAMFGQQPAWNRGESVVVDVDIDDAVEVPPEVEFSCSGACAPEGFNESPCEQHLIVGWEVGLRPDSDDTPTIVLYPDNGIFGIGVRFELFESGDGWRARAFLWPFTDSSTGCPLSETTSRTRPEHLAREGRLTLNRGVREPGELHGSMHLLLSECYTLDGVF